MAKQVLNYNVSYWLRSMGQFPSTQIDSLTAANLCG